MQKHNLCGVKGLWFRHLFSSVQFCTIPFDFAPVFAHLSRLCCHSYCSERTMNIHVCAVATAWPANSPRTPLAHRALSCARKDGQETRRLAISPWLEQRRILSQELFHVPKWDRYLRSKWVKGVLRMPGTASAQVGCFSCRGRLARVYRGHPALAFLNEPQARRLRRVGKLVLRSEPLRGVAMPAKCSSPREVSHGLRISRPAMQASIKASLPLSPSLPRAFQA